ncbi:MAG: type III-A CRISPR-associated RAMP protein Csm5 [Endomicrobiia bacterium]
MKNLIFEQYKLNLHIISPVHIGCDEVYEPTNFVINEQKKKLIHFDPLDFVKILSSEDKNKFSQICMSDDLLEIFKFIKQKYNSNVNGREIDIAEGLIKHYNKVLVSKTFNKKEVINQFLINRTVYNPNNNLPYIPGSSIKGALRTAYLTELSLKNNLKNCWEKYLNERDMLTDKDSYYWIDRKDVSRKFEKDLLAGSFATDPFRLVKVSDFLPTKDVQTKIFYAMNKKKKKSKYEARGPFQIFETIVHGSVFEGNITVFKPEKNAEIKRTIQLDSLLKSAHNLYYKLMQKEIKMLNTIDINFRPTIKKGLPYDSFGKTTFIIRIGRHSGAEAVTIEGNRKIKIQQGNKPPKFLGESTTTWLTSSEVGNLSTNNTLLPFGWAILEELN